MIARFSDWPNLAQVFAKSTYMPRCWHICFYTCLQGSRIVERKIPRQVEQAVGKKKKPN